MKNKIFIICPTYRADGLNEKLRLFGASSLVKQIERLRNDDRYRSYDLKLSIVDSSQEAHPMFLEFNNGKSEWLLYSQISDRNNINEEIKNNFPKSLKFIGTDKNFKTSKKWKTLLDESIAYDNFFPWEDGYPRKCTTVISD